MANDYYIQSKALTAKLIGREGCGPTSHANCVTNYDWCLAEVQAQNDKHGHEVYVVRHGELGTVWVALKEKPPANWIKEPGDA